MADDETRTLHYADYSIKYQQSTTSPRRSSAVLS